MKEVEKKYQCLPFWSWNDELDKERLVEQVEWMNANGVGGFFMHARSGLKTEYLGEKWFDCIKACSERAEELGMEAYAYDENGWPSGFVGGKLLEDIENHDRYLTYTIGEYDEKAAATYDMSGMALQRVHAPCKECLNVYWHYATSTADILNGEVVDKFLAMTHEEYKKRDTYHLKGFFTDEPQYYRWGTSYTKMIDKYFQETYGEDIWDSIGLLFVEKEGYRAFRYKYWKALQTLMLGNFAKKVYDWCDSNGYQLTGHFIQEGSLGGQMTACAGIMPFYEYEHIPGIDWLERSAWKAISAPQVASVAAQLGKKQIITETYGCCGWDVTPQELKEIAECQYVDGVNLMCQHLLPYSEHGQRKRDYPAHYSDVNPWVRKNFKQFNDYFSVIGKLLAESEPIANVAILHPIRSTYFNYKRTGVDKLGIQELETSIYHVEWDLSWRQIPHHYLDETLLAKYGKVEGKQLIMGNCAYDYIIFPKIYTMDKTTEALLSQYVKAGGKVLLTDERPTWLEGEPYVYDYLESNVTWEEIIAAQPYTAKYQKQLYTSIRKESDGKTFIYALNLGEDTDVEFQIKDGTSFLSYDVFKDEYTAIGTSVHLDKGESKILYISTETPIKQKTLKPLYLGKAFTVLGTPKNYLFLDFIRYSTDGTTYSEPLHHMGIFQELLKNRYAGDLYLKYEAVVEEIPNECILLAENTNTIWVEINGHRVDCCGSSKVEKDLFQYDIVKQLKKGSNEIVVKMQYFQSEQVYYALFGENVTESLRNCLAYDSDIEAVALKGDFGVYGEFEEGKKANVVLGKNFRIGKQNKLVSDLVEQGYPFFSGDIHLKQTVVVDDVDCELIIEDRFQLLEIKVNGVDFGKWMFGKRLDISKALRVGENEIELILTVGNRNLLGPFHTLEQEDMNVGPNTWERMGTWKDGKSTSVMETYAFVKGLV